jgi:hypothetical protein
VADQRAEQLAPAEAPAQHPRPLAPVVAGQVTSALSPPSEAPAGGDECQDDPEASETPTLPAGLSLYRRPWGDGELTFLAPPISAAIPRRPDLAPPVLGLLPPPVPFHGGTALPLRC